MEKKILAIVIVSFAFIFSSCGKKTIPSKTATITPSKSNNTIAEKPKPEKEKPAPVPPKTDTVSIATVAEEKPAPKPADKPDFPKVISVNDDAASKSVDGRLFYDVLGHRYWKNYSDGKYYLFDKSMYSNPDFKPRK